jgi:AraC-like DNA-binding protein
MPSVPTVFARSVRKIANAVASGGNPGHLLRAVGLDRDSIADPLLRIPYADMMLLTEHAARMTRDADFGLHVGEREHPRSYGIIGRSMITSSTLGEALRCQVRYLPIWTNVGAFRLDVEGPVAHFEWLYSAASLPESRHDCEMSMATVANFSRLLSSPDWRPREVWFQHPKPKDTSEHARVFRAPVRFGMPKNALLFDSRLLAAPVRTAILSAHQEITATAEQLLARAPDVQPLSQIVLTLIRQGMSSGDFDLNALSCHLGISRRTLQRRLRHESSSHRELVQQARRELSHLLLVGADATAVETAVALGFSEPSAFHHAFHRWHGMPPQAYKRGRAHRSPL